jgi:uncharacterized membrane protein YdjX (TVP38/TMEM64 family)
MVLAQAERRSFMPLVGPTAFISALSMSVPLAGSRAWLQATDWLSTYGLLTIFGLMALPLPFPKLPMLAVAGIYRLPIADVFIAILVGKIIKYLAFAYWPHGSHWLCAFSPNTAGSLPV